MRDLADSDIPPWNLMFIDRICDECLEPMDRDRDGFVDTVMIDGDTYPAGIYHFGCVPPERRYLDFRERILSTIESG